MDWKEALAAMQGLPEGESLPDGASGSSADDAVPPAKRQKSPLHIVMEKKGRGGKTATIVEGFDIPDEDVEEIGRDLRRRLGTGGSARGGEILIQGDRRDDVRRLLSELGFRCKG